MPSLKTALPQVTRDKALAEWEFPEGIETKNWGSGYPGGEFCDVLGWEASLVGSTT